MGVFNKIFGKKEEKAEKPEKNFERGDLVPVKKKSVAKKVETAKTEKIKKEAAKRKVSRKDENIAHKILFENMISEKSTMPGILDRTCLTPIMASSTKCGPSASIKT